MLKPENDPIHLQERETTNSLQRPVDRCRTAALSSEFVKRLIPGQVKRVGRVLAAIVAVVLVSLSTASAEEVCHLTGGGKQLTVDVPPDNVADHLAHGDSLGPCYPPQNDVPYTCSTSAVEYEILYVSPDAGAAQKGTMERPFGSISSALQFAEKRGFPGVELQIKPGVYGDDAAVLSRPTRIVGPGQYEDPTVELSLSIINDGAYELGIQGVVFQAADSGPAITVANPAADTALCNIGFESVVGHALHQTGGSVLIEDGIFNTTARDPGAINDDHLTGTAIVLNGGALGLISRILVDGSAGSGLYLSGSGTMVAVDWDGSSQSLFENGTGCLGAVVVEGGAGLIARRLTLDNNVGKGIEVEGTGTTVDLPFFVATSAQPLGGDLDLMAATCGYNAVSNVVARSGATMDISGSPGDPFIISGSDLVGLIIRGIDPPVVSLSNGLISNSPIGISLQIEDPNTCETYLERLSIDNVGFVNNEVDRDFVCGLEPPPLREWACSNGVDDDLNGLTDCDDPNCASFPGCSAP